MIPKNNSEESAENGDACGKNNNSQVDPRQSTSAATANPACVSLCVVQEKDYMTSPNKSKSTENLSSTPAKTKHYDTASVNNNDPPKATEHKVATKSSKKKSSACLQIEKEGKTSEEYLPSKDLKVDKENSDDEQQKGWKRFLGLFLGIAAAFQFSMSALIIKVLGYHPFNLGTWRFGVMIFFPLVILSYSTLYRGRPFFEHVWPNPSFKSCFLIMVQAIVAANSIILTFFGFKFLDIADCIVIGTSAPVFVTLVAFMFLGERCGLFPVLTALLALVGVGIISKPPILTGEEALDEESMYGVASSFSSMILLTICYVVLRYLRKVHHALLNLIFGIWGFLQSMFMANMMDVFDVPDSYQEVLLIILSAFLAFGAQTCLTIALKYENAGPVALVRTTEVIFAFGWQAIFLGVTPDIYSVIGALVTMSGVVLTALRKIVVSLPEDDKNRKRFNFLTL